MIEMADELTPEEKIYREMKEQAAKMDHTLTSENRRYIELANKVYAMEGNIKNSEDFLELLDLLRDGYSEGILPKQPVDAYIAGMIGVIELIDEDIDEKRREPVGPVDWQWLAYVVSRAFEN